MRWKPLPIPESSTSKKTLKKWRLNRNWIKPKRRPRRRSNTERIRAKILTTLLLEKAELTTVKMLTWTIKTRRMISWEESWEGTKTQSKCQTTRSQSPTAITEPLTETPQLTPQTCRLIKKPLIWTRIWKTWWANLNKLLIPLPNLASSSLWSTGCLQPLKPLARNRYLTGPQISLGRNGLTLKG